jgi:hypothetical protein
MVGAEEDEKEMEREVYDHVLQVPVTVHKLKSLISKML